jgi:hypothetical protein
MIKINGVRVELGEIEAALVDETGSEESVDPFVVVNAAVVARSKAGSNNNGMEIQVFCVLSDVCAGELGVLRILRE